MSAKGLEWASRTRADLVIRIEDLRATLADVEPLRQELARLEGQLKGVERLLAVYHDQLGYPAPWAEGSPAGEADILPVKEPDPAAARVLSPPIDAPRLSDVALKELTGALLLYGVVAAEALRAVRVRLAKWFHSSGAIAAKWFQREKLRLAKRFPRLLS